MKHITTRMTTETLDLDPGGLGRSVGNAAAHEQADFLTGLVAAFGEWDQMGVALQLSTIGNALEEQGCLGEVLEMVKLFCIAADPDTPNIPVSDGLDPSMGRL